MIHIRRITMARANAGKFSEEEVINILDYVFSFVLDVIDAKGKNVSAT